MIAAPGLGGRESAIVCAVWVGVLLVVLALPSPWGLGAFESNQPAVRIVSFQWNASFINPGGPAVILTVENTGSSSIVYLSASLDYRPFEMGFLSVSTASPLEPMQSVSGHWILIGPDSPYCGSLYDWTISGNFSSGSGFEVHTSAPFTCPPPDVSQAAGVFSEGNP